VLSTAPPRRLMAAVASGEAARLKAPGVGKRTAERIIVELREKVGDALLADGGDETALDAAPADGAPGGPDEPVSVAREALTGLGYAPNEIDALLRGAADEGSAEALIAHALRSARR
jgi:Holliday junction DNA helicase RuvA